MTEDWEYYLKKLAGEHLRRCYEVGSSRIQQFLRTEIEFIISKLKPRDIVLDLGCGYGRVAFEICPYVEKVVGIDSSDESLELGRTMLNGRNIEFRKMNAADLAFKDNMFDFVICVQNGISAFKVDQEHLITEAVRACRPGGLVFFSSYSENFWDHRLEWFERQAEENLLGEIDYSATKNGEIVCKDGFRATTVGPAEFGQLAYKTGIVPEIEEVDGSSVFCTLKVV